MQLFNQDSFFFKAEKIHNSVSCNLYLKIMIRLLRKSMNYSVNSSSIWPKCVIIIIIVVIIWIKRQKQLNQFSGSFESQDFLSENLKNWFQTFFYWITKQIIIKLYYSYDNRNLYLQIMTKTYVSSAYLWGIKFNLIFIERKDKKQ